MEWLTWYIWASIFCVVFLSLSSPFHLRLALSRSLLQYLRPWWPFPQNPHHPHQTPSLSPFRANLVHLQTQVCQGGVVLQTLCQCLTANNDLQNTWWNHLKFFEFTYKKSQRLLPHSSHTSSDTDISCRSQMKWNEMKIHSDPNAWPDTSQHQPSM